MKLITKKLAGQFKKHPLMSQRIIDKNAIVLVKYFNLLGTATWLITEAEELVDGDWLLYGYFKKYGKWSWGYIKLSELSQLNDGYHNEVERDLYVPEASTVAETQRMRGGLYV